MMWEDADYMMLSKEGRTQNYIKNMLTVLLFITPTQRKHQKNSKMIVTLIFFIALRVFFKLKKIGAFHIYYSKRK